MDLEELFKPILDELQAATPRTPQGAGSMESHTVKVQTFPLDEAASDLVLQGVAKSLQPGAWTEILVWSEVAFRKSFHGHWAFDDFRKPSERIVLVPSSEVPAEMWFIGDLHGDLLALEMAFQHIERNASAAIPPCIILLGDLVDDGPHGFEVFLRVLRELAERPCRLGILAGNHDEALTQRDGVFTSQVDPSDFAEWLNRHSGMPLVRRGGRLFAELFAQAPRAIFLDEGLFLSHGGVPHTDLHGTIHSRADLEQPECLQDFSWARASSRLPEKQPDRSSRGHQFGHQDFDAFCALAQELLQRPVKHLLRGHDHTEARFDLHAGFQANQLTTLNTMGHRLDREFGGPYSRTPCVAVKRREQPLEIHRLELEERFLASIYPEPNVPE
jgi:hypothetical protein